MEIRVLQQGLAGHFRTAAPLVTQVVLETVDGFRLVHCDFPDEEDERQFLESQKHTPITDGVEYMKNMGGSGMITLLEDESNSRIEIFGSVRALAPALRKAADEFEARLAQLPTA